MPNKSKQIDQLIPKLYTNKKYSELEALSKLFGDKFLFDLESILNDGLRNEPNYSEHYQIQHGWIDKIPLADFINTEHDYNGNEITQKVELGDFLIIFQTYNECMHEGKKRTDNFNNRALICQAKISNLRNPTVPIVQMSSSSQSSTSKEYKLLSEWPAFDLYKTSRSKDPLLTSLNLRSEDEKAIYAGFHNNQWDIGLPQMNTICNKTFGDTIIDLIEGRLGKSFNKKGNSNDWDKLTNELISVCQDYQMPKSLFGKILGGKRIVGNSKPIGPLFFFFFMRNKPKFPVLIINRVMREGSELN